MFDRGGVRKEIKDFPTISQAKRLVPFWKKLLLIYILGDWVSIDIWQHPNHIAPGEFFIKKCSSCGWVIDCSHTNTGPRCGCYYRRIRRFLGGYYDVWDFSQTFFYFLDKMLRFKKWTISSAARALHSHCRSRRFESCIVHSIRD